MLFTKWCISNPKVGRFLCSLKHCAKLKQYLYVGILSTGSIFRRDIQFFPRIDCLLEMYGRECQLESKMCVKHLKCAWHQKCNLRLECTRHLKCGAETVATANYDKSRWQDPRVSQVKKLLEFPRVKKLLEFPQVKKLESVFTEFPRNQPERRYKKTHGNVTFTAWNVLGEHFHCDIGNLRIQCSSKGVAMSQTIKLFLSEKGPSCPIGQISGPLQTCITQAT